MRLVTLPALESFPPSLDGSAGVEVWRDTTGRLCAVGYRTPPDHSLFVPGIGTFRFGGSSESIVVQPLPSVTAELLDDAYHRIAMPLALQFSGIQVLHASAVRYRDGVVALCGHAGAGKSTLAFALSRRGYELCADDAVAFDPSEEPILVSALPFRMRLRAASAEFFAVPSLLKGRERSTAWAQAEPAPFAALFVLDRPAGFSPGDIEVERLSSVDAFKAMLPHAYYVVIDDAPTNRRLVLDYLELAERLPVFALRYHPGLNSIVHITEAIERELASS
jgi:hypothetical protein